MADMPSVADVVRQLAREGSKHRLGEPRTMPKPHPEWRKIRNAGTALWLDTGDMDEARGLWNAEFEALTTNNTLLNKEVQKGIYDTLVGRAAAAIKAAAPDTDDETLVLEISFVLNAYHALRLVEQFDAHVSVELHTALAGDVERTIAYGRRYHEICPQRFYVKIPFTPAGLLGARKLAKANVPINLTLGFSARQNYLAALFAQPKYVNVFMGRLNAVVSDNLLGDGRNVGEKATLATQRELLALRRGGRTMTLLIGASMRDGSQVASLAGVDVFTMPPKVVSQFQQRPVASVTPQVGRNPIVTANAGIKMTDFAAPTLWDVPKPFKDAVETLLRQDADRMAPEDIVSHFEMAGLHDLFPRWPAEAIEAVVADGKIPVYARWSEALASGAVGLDALMNLSALYSFVSDQKALDDRIRSVLA